MSEPTTNADPAKIRVLLVDDHPFMRQGVRDYLDEHEIVEIVGEADNGLDALRMARSMPLDIILLDITIPGIDGLMVTRLITKELPGIKVVILSVSDDDATILEAARSGAKGYVRKTDSAIKLIESIQSVHRGEAYFGAKVMDMILTDYVATSAKSGKNPATILSSREREVLGLITDGHLNKEIADKLSVSIHTVESHREKIHQKLDIRSVAGLTKFAIVHGISKL